ncbi:MAG: hypothetical protein A2511_16465 [Deltaproteobacteria bacterium RIFOXYD12_FULL_50_9]|nr:MAG: hypothetical protein A2511_16465 [Deltaproteobacteria bacterium RIFOXYD12_FULL_50_9]
MSGGESVKVEIKKSHIAQGVALTSIILIMPALRPEFAWLYFLVPLPSFYLTTIMGRKGSGITIGLAIVLSSLIAGLFGDISVMLFALGLLPAGFSLAHSLRVGETPHRAGLRAVLTALLFWAALWALIAFDLGTNPYQESVKTLDQSITSWYELYVKSAPPQAERTKEIEIAVTQLRNLTPKIFPALMLVSVCITIWLNMLIGHWLLSKSQTDHTPWPNYRNWELPDHLVWGVVLGITGLIIPGDIPHVFALNLLIVLGTLFFFQGLAVLSHLLNRWRFPGLLRSIIYLIFFLQVFGIVILSIMGLLDTWLDIRRRKPKENDNADQAVF